MSTTIATSKPIKSPRTRKALMDLAQSLTKESDVQRTCSEWLALDSWRAIITDPPQLRGLGVTEKGIPDRLYIRYWTGCIDQSVMTAPHESWAQVLWIEYKKLGGKPKPHQDAWIAAERARGALIIVVDDFGTFRDWYVKSGLARKIS